VIQKMMNYVTINIPNLDLSTVSDVTVTFKQKSTGTELTYTDTNIKYIDGHTMTVKIPKEDAMKLNRTPIQGQVMFIQNGVPNATEVFMTSVEELLKGDGYGD
jgi:hypothetical protein